MNTLLQHTEFKNSENDWNNLPNEIKKIHFLIGDPSEKFYINKDVDGGMADIWHFFSLNAVIKGTKSTPDHIYLIAKKYKGQGCYNHLYYDVTNNMYFIDMWFYDWTSYSTELKGIYTFDEMVKIICDRKRYYWTKDDIFVC